MKALDKNALYHSFHSRLSLGFVLFPELIIPIDNDSKYCFV